MERERGANGWEGAMRGINAGVAPTRCVTCCHLGSRYLLYLKLTDSQDAINRVDPTPLCR
jgi:hypothetical protein